MQETEAILAQLQKAAHRKNIEGMQRYGIRFRQAYGVKRNEIRAIASFYGKNTALAEELWKQDIHEAYLVAIEVMDPQDFTPRRMDQWVHSLYSWDICDSMLNPRLLRKADFLHEKIREYVRDENEFVRRAAFSLIVYRAVHDKQEPDETFVGYLHLIEHYADDPRNFVKKAINWALRQIGKRNLFLNQKALEVADRLKARPEKCARWIGTDACRELTDPHILRRIKR